jgi:Flp pilus assembly protein TadG
MTRLLQDLRDDRRGLALLEFAFTLPILLTMSMMGAELTNYVTVRMRMSQIALQVADNAARMGTSVAYGAKQVSEADINDVFTGSQMESAGLDIATNGKIILSDLEPTATGATTYKIRWQRCYGNKAHASTYGVAGDTGKSGMGPSGSQVTALDGSATMFVEVYYVYKPLINASWAPSVTMTEVASMAVRDNRDLTGGSSGVYPVTGVTAATC